MEEELSEKEDITMAMDSHVEEQGSAHANTDASETQRKDDMHSVLAATTAVASNQQVPESDVLESAAEQANSSLGALSNNIEDMDTPKNSSQNVTSATATTEPKSGPDKSVTKPAENLEGNEDADADAKACVAAVHEKVVEMKHRTELAGATIESKNNEEQPKTPQEEQVPKSELTINVGTGASDVSSQGSVIGNVAEQKEPAGREENMAKKDGPPQDFTKLTVVQLKDKLRDLNLHVTGRKQELIDRLNGHLYPNLKNTGVVEEAQSTKTTSPLAEDQPSAKQEAEKPTPSKSSSAVRRSNREKKPSLKVAEHLDDTPISALSHPVDSETDDDDVVEAEQFDTKEADSPGVPKSIVTRKRSKKSQPSLAAVPEDNAVEEAKIGEKAVPIKSAGEEVSKRSTRSQSTRPTKKREDSKESAAPSSVSTRASKRTAASVSTRASKRVEKSPPSSSKVVMVAAEGTWKCHKCNATNSPERKRCEGCFGWKGGHHPRKKLELGGETSVASSRRSARQKSKSKGGESPSVSVATRRSTRGRVVKKL